MGLTKAERHNRTMSSIFNAPGAKEAWASGQEYSRKETKKVLDNHKKKSMAKKMKSSVYGKFEKALDKHKADGMKFR